MSVQRTKYDSDIKRNAVQLAEESDKTVAEIADDLGTGKDFLYRWRLEYLARHGLAFPGNGKEALTSLQQKIRELEKKLKDTEMKRDIYKMPWPFSAEHRTEISVHREQSFVISGEENMPSIQCIPEWILPMEKDSYIQAKS